MRSSKILALLPLLALVARQVRSDFRIRPRPVRILHGLTGSCKLEAENCIETGEGPNSFFDLRLQARNGCEVLRSQIFDENDEILEEFKYGFHLVGYSQGGFIAMLIYKICQDIRPLIKTISAWGAPLTGMDKMFKKFDFMGDLSWGQYAKVHADNYELATGQTVNDKRFSLATLFNYGGNRSDVIDELTDPGWGGFGGLDMFLAVGFSDETVISPLESSTFGTKFDKSAQKFDDFRNYRYYKLNQLGVLFNDNRLWLCMVKGDHLMFDGLTKYEGELFGSDPDDDTKFQTQEELMERYRSNLINRVKNYDFKWLNCKMKNSGSRVVTLMPVLMTRILH